MASETNDTNKTNDEAKKRSWLVDVRRAIWKVFLFFSCIGLIIIAYVGYFSISYYCDLQYDKTGDHWEQNEDNTIIRLHGSEITDSDLNSLADRHDVAAVYLHACPNITDACIESLARIPNLRRLVIVRCKQIKNPDFSKLSHLKRLTRLSVKSCSGLTDEAAKGIARLRSLKILHLTGCSSLTPGGVSQLKSLPLVEFGPPECVLKDDTISEVVKFKRLRCLYIAGKKGEELPLTDKGFFALEKMKEIRAIELEGCPNISIESTSKLAQQVNSHRGMWDYELCVSSNGGGVIPVGYAYADYRMEEY